MSQRRTGGKPQRAKARDGARNPSAENTASDKTPAPTGAAEPIVTAAPSKPGRINVTSGLHVVATPIGNLADISLRALDVLRRADVIACEDTRITGKLRAAYGIATPMTPYHEHNAERARPALIERLKRGRIVALVSDAGTPLISDPGYRLVRAAIAEGIAVTTVPGPSAPIAAMVLSGLPTDRFYYAGFLPPRQAARRDVLARLVTIDASLVFLESPRRLASALADMADVLGARDAAIARELTKLHEEVRRASLAELAGHYRDAGAPRGEVVVMVGPPAAGARADIDLDGELRRALATMSVRDAAAEIAAATGLPRRVVYARALALTSEDGDAGWE